MKLPVNVKIKKGWWHITPVLSQYTANAIYPNIYLPESLYTDLLSDKPTAKSVSILIHEQTHIDRQKKLGWLYWSLQYTILADFRFNEEIEAITSAMKYLKQHGQEFDTERSAKFLSGYLYLWCCRYDTAKEVLDNIWKSI